MDAREAPLGVEGGSCTPDPVSEPAEPVGVDPAAGLQVIVRVLKDHPNLL